MTMYSPTRNSPAWIAILLLFSFVLSGCTKKNQEVPTQSVTASLNVEAISPAQEQWPERVSASGEIAAWQETIIGAEVGGARLDEVLVDVGARVNKGQLLARFNEDGLRIDLARMEAAFAEAQANYEQAKADAERAVLLDQTGSLSQQDIHQFKTKAAAAAAQLASSAAQRDAQRLKLRYSKVLAPDSGVISARTATVGAVINTNAELFRMIRGDRIEWRAEVDAESLGRLKSGIKVSITTPNGKNVEAKLRQLAPTVNRDTGNALAYVDVPSQSGLAPGMYVSGELILGSTDSIALPESAIVLRDGYQYVMKIDDRNLVHQIKIVTRRRHGNAIEIIGNQIKMAEKFVLAGGGLLNDGDLVSVIKRSPQTLAKGNAQ